MTAKKRVLITGATGMIGRPLSKALIERGYEVIVLTRNPETAPAKTPGAADYIQWAPGQPGEWSRHLDDAQAVISLAGEPLFAGRVSRARYEYANQTRILGVRGLVKAMRQAAHSPKVFLCSSSVGIYGFQGPDDAIVTEDTPRGSDYHALGNTIWEYEATPATWMGVRTALLRTGIVWGPDDGMAYQQLAQFRRGWGGVVGDGLNWVPWIHIKDEVGIILHLLEQDGLQGPFNLSAPKPVQYRDYARFMGDIAGKPSDRRMPEFTTQLFMGRVIADMILHNRRMLPQRALESGYVFQFPEAKAALLDLLPRE